MSSVSPALPREAEIEVTNSLGWKLRVAFRVVNYGRRAHGVMRTLHSDDYERDEGEAPDVQLLAVWLRSDHEPDREMELPSWLLSPAARVEIEAEVIVRLERGEV